MKMIERLLSSTNFECSLSGLLKKVAVTALFVIPSAILLFQGAMVAVTSRLSNSTQGLRRALALEANNPDLHHRLGLEDLYNFQSTNPAEGLDQLRQATRLTPDRGLYWSDLASACEIAGDLKCADPVMGRALSALPMMPRIHWLAASQDLSAHRIDAAEIQLRQLLQLSPAYAEPAFSLCFRNGFDPQTVMDKVIPSGRPPRLTLQYASYLVGQEQFDAASRVWNETAAGHTPFPFSLAEPYLNSLMRAQKYNQAWEAWKDLEKRGLVKIAGSGGPDNLVFNGSFEAPPVDTGFDWIYGEEPFVSLDFSSPEAYQGAHSLRLNFTVSRNREYEPFYEIIPVAPDRNYMLQAYVRSANITSDSGPRLRIVDVLDPKQLSVSSDPTIGTTGWHPVRLAFSTGSETHFVRLSIWRPQSQSFPYRISGTFWLDKVSLKPSTASSK